MKKKWASIILLLVLSSLAVTLPNVGIVKAQITIYIRADGSVRGTNRIKQIGAIYTFTSNVTGSIIVEMDGIVIDGSGFWLEGTEDET